LPQLSQKIVNIPSGQRPLFSSLVVDVTEGFEVGDVLRECIPALDDAPDDGRLHSEVKRNAESCDDLTNKFVKK
jgi:hypothetical protein